MGSVLVASDFDPNGNYFASTMTALDTHKIRVQSTNSSSVLANAFALDKGHKLTCLSWGLFSSVNNSKQQRKKRRQSNEFSIENQFLAVGLNKGSILIYSPLTNEVIAKLDNPNASAITDFHYSSLTNSGWSVDLGQTVVEWDSITYKPKRQFNIGEPINVIKVIEYNEKPHLLLASHSVLLVDLESQEIIKTFPGHISPIHTLLPITSNSFITAAESDRYINIYPLEGPPIVLVAQSNVLSVSYGNKTVSAVTEDGILEVFNDPFTKAAATSKRKGQQSKQSNSKIELKRLNTSTLLKIENSFINDNTITITWLEDASIPYFEKISLTDITTELTTIFKEKPAIQVKEHSLFGQDIAAPKSYNESNAVVTSGDNLRFLDNKEVQEGETLASDEEDNEDGPTLAEKLEALKVQQPTLKKKQGRATAGSLAVVLTQALKANDRALLETVLSTRDETVLKNTVQRLDTSLAVTLLERLAERIARQTHRQGQLNVWVKWVMAIHGGYLVNISNLNKSLSSLHSTLTRRAATLPRLLELRGRLDVLHCQQELRLATNEDDEHYDSDDSDVEYVEELSDANLIDDGEQDFEQDEEGFVSVDEESSDEEIPLADKLEDGEVDDEEGYSDLEVHGNGNLEEQSESENEQDALKERIAKLKAKQQRK